MFEACMRENEISGIIVDVAIEVHRTLGGPGLLESIYEERLVKRGIHRVVNGLQEISGIQKV
jgi:hypothetical protein